jgi:hypothetical protein
MRKVLLTLATASLLLSVMTFAPLSADAMTLGDPAAVATQAQSSLLQQVDCRTIWRCGYWGCGWRNVCWGDRDDRWRDRGEWRERHEWREHHDRDGWRRDRY